jgi:hypothetical protein
LTVVVIDDDVFTRAFGAATRYNKEEEIVAIGDGRAAEEIPFHLGIGTPTAHLGADGLTRHRLLGAHWRYRERILGF